MGKFMALGDRLIVTADGPAGLERVSMTKQCHKSECDINRIMAKYALGGEPIHINKAMAQYGDFSNAVEFSEALHNIAKAEAAFADLPVEIRDLMGNSAEVFMYRMEDPEWRAKFAELGAFDPEAGPIEEASKSAPVLEPEPPLAKAPDTSVAAHPAVDSPGVGTPTE